jgi:hypothetical protein
MARHRYARYFLRRHFDLRFFLVPRYPELAFIILPYHDLSVVYEIAFIQRRGDGEDFGVRRFHGDGALGVHSSSDPLLEEQSLTYRIPRRRRVCFHIGYGLQAD